MLSPSFIIATVIVMTFAKLYEPVLPLVLGGVLDPLDHTAFQAPTQHRPGLHVLADFLAMSRKFVILDTETTPATSIASARRSDVGPGPRVLAAARS